MTTSIRLDAQGGEDFFPDAERFLYRHSPLRQVICQLRFPSILRIESAAPADFQEDIRHVFPIFHRQALGTVQNIPSEVMQLLGASVVSTTYLFATEVGELQLTLNIESLSLTCNKYIRWEDFKGVLDLSLRALAKHYKPSFYNRLGLRYLNVIDRKILKREELKWSSLINPQLLGEVALPHIENHLLDARKAIRIRDNQSSLLIQHGLAIVDGKTTPDAYLIDSDFYTDDREEVDNAEQVLDGFHSRARRVFRWAISDQLHDALGPEPCP